MSALLQMLALHALCDYPLQGDWLSKAKNHKLTLVPGEAIWPGALACHAGIHASAVWMVTQSWLLAAFELIAHSVIDYAKCDGRLSYNQDQAMHVGCKVTWAALLVTFGGLP
ncbi:DUF3307 domain-containing protein [Aureimonas psammosilenae]|uniref:DUF3307 domain-containing protein n=1 Tax=Aureimonas psammosilenae TaxID=2495496 RepID=UPI001260CAFA|nr:DUF3307 domain-containing protein [Aureimonas psammosilenae]